MNILRSDLARSATQPPFAVPLTLIHSPGRSCASCARDIRASLRSTRGEGGEPSALRAAWFTWEVLHA